MLLFSQTCRSNWCFLFPSTHNHLTIGVFFYNVNGIVEGTNPHYVNGEENQCCFLFRLGFAVLLMHALP